MLPSFEKGHFVRVCAEKIIDYQNKENRTRSSYSNQNRMKALILLMLSKSIKKSYLINSLIEQSTKLCDSGKVLPGLLSEFYQGILI